MRARRPNPGFTLLEVVVSSAIGAFIMIVAVSTLRLVATGREAVSVHSESTDEIRFAAEILRRDMNNLFRDTQMRRMRFTGGYLEGPSGPQPSLTMWIVSDAPARRGQPEADTYEVQYYLVEAEEKLKLMRRQCPIVTEDRESEEYMESTGGILTTLAEDIVQLSLLYFDGYDWLDQWPEELTYLPELVQVELTARLPDDEELVNPIHRTFMIRFPRTPPQLKAQLDETSEASMTDITQGTELQ